MASTFLDEKISSFIEDKFPEFVKADHPVFVEFLRLYYQFMEASKLTLKDIQQTDQILLENKLTTNYLANERDDTRFVYENSVYGAFIKDEVITGQTSGATATILAEDNAGSCLYIETNRHFQVGEIVVGGTSAASATIEKYQGNPVQTIQQLLEYVDIDNTISDFLTHFRNSYLTAVPNTLATGVSKRKLIKSVRDLYRAKGTRKGHELFFRLMFDETPELTFPTENILKVSAGDWSSDTILRVVATENNPANLIGQTVSQTVNIGLDHGAASANVESVLQLQEGETTVYQLVLNVASVSGTFIAGAEVSGIDSTDADVSITGTVQPILVGATVTNGSANYTTNDTVTITSSSGQNAIISIVDVGSGEIGQIVIDNPGTGYTVGDPLFFDNTNTEGAGASAIVSCIDGAIAPEAGDVAEYGMDTFDHIIFEEGTEVTDAYTGSQIQIETGTLASLSASSEAGEAVNVTVFSPGSGYEVMPIIKPATHRLTFNSSALTTSGKFSAGETITNNANPSVSATITTSLIGKITIAESTGSFATGQIITGSLSNANATLTAVDALGANATFLGWATTGLGSITGVEVSNFGTGFSTAPDATVPVKMLLTRKIISGTVQANITLATAFAAGDTVIGQTSSARGVVTAWDNTRQTLTVRTTQGTFQKSETLTRGAGTNYAVISEIAQGTLSTTIGTVGATAGQFNNDKGKISESLMRIQDSYYYQDFSYVVKVGAAIKDWRAEIKKAVHPAGFAMFGEVSITNKVATLMTVPVTGITSETPTLASLFEAVITTVVGRRLGTNSDGTTLLGSTEIKGTTDHVAGTLKRGSHLGHEPQLFSTVEAITRSGTTATVETTGPHGAVAGEQVEISGVTSVPYDSGPPQLSDVETTSITRSGSTATVTTPAAHGLTTGENVIILGAAPSAYNGEKTITVTTTTQFTFSIASGTTTPATDSPTFTVIEYNGVHEVLTVTDDKFTITVSSRNVSPATVGVGKVKLVSPFDNSTRDVTLRPHTDVTVFPLYGDWATNQRSRYGLGPRQSNAIKYMWATPPTEYTGTTSTTTTENHQITLESGLGEIIQEPEVLARVDYAVTAETGKFIIDGTDKPALTLDGQRIYRFDLSDSSVSSHPFKLSEVSDGTHAGSDLPRVDYAVTVASGTNLAGATGNIYVIDGSARPALSLDGARLYRFDLSNSSVSGHPFKFSTVSNGLHANPVLNRVDYTVTVASGTRLDGSTGNIYVLSGVARPTLSLQGSRLYRFDLSDSSVSGHPFNFSVTSNGTHGGGSSYSTGVTVVGTPGNSGAYVEILTQNTSSTLHYYCSNHSNMGSSLGIVARVIAEEYTTGVTVVGTPGNSGAYVEILTTNTTGTLHYYCGNHSNMGSNLSISSRVVTGVEYNAQSPIPLDFAIELESGTESAAGVFNLLTEDNEKLTIQIFDRVVTHGTQGSAGAYLELFTENAAKTLYYYCSVHSGMGNSLSVTQERVGDNLISETYQLGGSDAISNIILEDGSYILYETDTDPEEQSVIVSEDSTITYGSITEDVPNRVDDQMAYAYPNMTRRESPETGTDNVDAGGAGIYDTTMNYTNIQIGTHESNVHNRISDFGQVRIVDIIKSGREFLEIGEQTNKHEGDDGYEFTLMEDGSYIQMEAGSAGIPTTSRKIWNVPPPSYIRLTTS